MNLESIIQAVAFGLLMISIGIGVVLFTTKALFKQDSTEKKSIAIQLHENNLQGKRRAKLSQNQWMVRFRFISYALIASFGIGLFSVFTLENITSNANSISISRGLLLCTVILLPLISSLLTAYLFPAEHTRNNQSYNWAAHEQRILNLENSLDSFSLITSDTLFKRGEQINNQQIGFSDEVVRKFLQKSWHEHSYFIEDGSKVEYDTKSFKSEKATVIEGQSSSYEQELIAQYTLQLEG